LKGPFKPRFQKPQQGGGPYGGGPHGGGPHGGGSHGGGPHGGGSRGDGPRGGGPPGAAGGKNRAPEQTLQEVAYLKQLIEKRMPVCVKLRNNEEVRGIIEYYDSAFIRVTRADAPNLFIFKHEIKYLYEDAAK
jgi:sRNA-binding regulator protein Hfq